MTSLKTSYMKRLSTVANLMLLGLSGPAMAQQVSPFSAGFFPKQDQIELSTSLAYLQSRYKTDSPLLRHQGDTLSWIAVPALRWGVAENYALEVAQPVAHLIKVAAYNPNVGVEGLRATSISAVRQFTGDGDRSARAAALVQINPSARSGLNVWGLSASAIAVVGQHNTASLTFAGTHNPTTGLVSTSLAGTWARPVGPWLVQASLGLAHYSAVSSLLGKAAPSAGQSYGLEISQEVAPQVWAGLGWGVASHSNRITTTPTQQLPFAMDMNNQTRLKTLTLTVRVTR